MNSRTFSFLSGIYRLSYIFLVTEKFVSSSGFEEILYQVWMCAVGEIKAVLSRKSNNMCWRLHEVAAEAISRLFREPYVAPLISGKLVEQSKSDHTTLKNFKEFEEYYVKYVEMQKRCSAGKLGVTAKYWMLYVRIVNLIHQLHSACNSWTTRIVLSRTVRIYLSLYYVIEGNYIGV